MGTLARAVSFGVLLSIAACGGSVVKVGQGDGGSPDLDCPMASGVTPGQACPNLGQVCTGSVSYSQCGGPPSTITESCTCSGQSWSCPPIVVSGGCPGPEVCPSPSSITPGAGCALPSSTSCGSDIPVLECDGVTVAGYEQCSCMSGQWLCGPVGTPACPVDASAPCPDPSTVFGGDGCTSPGVTCSGDPQTCGSTTLYDAVQCTGGVWQVVASTVCDVDSGLDADGPDGGKGI
jgi:hypothetical protein